MVGDAVRHVSVPRDGLRPQLVQAPRARTRRVSNCFPTLIHLEVRGDDLPNPLRGLEHGVHVSGGLKPMRIEAMAHRNASLCSLHSAVSIC